jgi:hypothetical protein
MGFTYTYSKPPARDCPVTPDTDLLLENTHVLPPRCEYEYVS